MFVFVFLFSQGEIYGRLQWNTFKQITKSASWFSRFNGCAYADLFFFNPASAASLISILNSANTEIKKEKVNSIQTCYYSTISILSSKTCCETLDIHYQDDMFFTLETGSFWPLSPRVGHCLHTLTVWQRHKCFLLCDQSKHLSQEEGREGVLS